MMASSRSTIIWSLLWGLLEKCSVQVVSFLVTIVLARLLLPEEYGIVALISIFIALATVIIDGGLNTALVQKKDANEEDFSTIFYVSMGLSLLMYVLLFTLAPVLASFYDMIELTLVIRVLSLSLFFYAFNSVQRAYVYKNMMFRQMFICSLIAVIISGIIGVYMAYVGYGVWSLVVQSISNIAFTSLIMWFVVKWRPRLVFSINKFKVLFAFGWKIFLTNFIVTLFVKIRALLIGKMYAPATLAYYDKGNQFSGLIMDNVCGTIQTVMFPAFSEVQDNKERVKQMMRRSINISCLIMFPLVVILIVCAKPLVIFLLTEKWLPCVPYIQILCIASFFRPITIPNGQAITAMGHSGITLKLEIIRKIVDISILCISCWWGAIAIAWGVVVFNFICLFINLMPNVKLLNYKIYEQVLDVLPIGIISVAMGLVISLFALFDMHPLLLIITQALSGAILYVFLCYIFKCEGLIYLIGIMRKK